MSNLKPITANSLQLVADHVNITKLNKATEEAQKMYDNIGDKLMNAAQNGEYSFKYTLPYGDKNLHQVYQIFYKILEKKGFKVDCFSNRSDNFMTITISWGKPYSKE